VNLLTAGIEGTEEVKLDAFWQNESSSGAFTVYGDSPNALCEGAPIFSDEANTEQRQLLGILQPQIHLSSDLKVASARYILQNI
jgi:hypothetical protein